MSDPEGWDDDNPRFMNEWDLQARGGTRTEQSPAKTYAPQRTGKRLITFPSPEEEKEREERYERYEQLSKEQFSRRKIQI